jgi:hypothetical protein
VALRKFRVEANIRSGADARMIEPLHVQRIGGAASPMEIAESAIIRSSSLRPGNKPLPGSTPSDPKAEANVPEKKE